MDGDDISTISTTLWSLTLTEDQFNDLTERVRAANSSFIVDPNFKSIFNQGYYQCPPHVALSDLNIYQGEGENDTTANEHNSEARELNHL